MKRVNWLIALLSVFSLTLVACGGDEVGEKKPVQKLPQTSTASFAAVVTELTYKSVSYKVTPTDLEKEYLCVLGTVQDVEECTLDRYLVMDINEMMSEQASTNGLTLEEYVAECVDKGVVEKEHTGLEAESEYYILVVSADDVVNEARDPEVLKLKFATPAVPDLGLTFDIETVINGTDATVTVTPSKLNTVWYYTLLSSAEYQQYLDPETLNMTPESVLVGLAKQSVQAALNSGMEYRDAIEETFHICNEKFPSETFNVSYLTYNTEYTHLVAGFLVDLEGNITLASPVYTETFSTGDIGEVNLTFNIEVNNIEALKASIKVTPSDLKQYFYWQVGEYDGKSSAEEVMKTVTPYMPYQGVQDYTGGLGSPYKMTLESPDTDYYVIAFGYAPGAGITTEPTMVTFRTLPAPAPEETTFTMKASSITAYGFTLKVTPSESSTYYVVEVVSPEGYNQDKAVADLEKYFADQHKEWLAAYPDLTPSQFWYNMSAYGEAYRGFVSLNVTQNPGTTVDGYVYAFDTKTDKVVKVHKVENLATTKTLCNEQADINIVGYYSGRDEAGSIFGDATKTANKAIMVVKYEGLDNVRSLFTYISAENLTNVNTYADIDIWTLILQDPSAKWRAMDNLNKPYEFCLVDWNTEQTVLAYVINNDGNMGPISRALGMATAKNKGNIEELHALVNQLNAKSASRLSVPQSLVVEE